MGMKQWSNHFIEVTKLISTKSKDPSTKVGSIIVDKNNRIVSTGYNGPPKNTDDRDIIFENREIKLKRTLHAELNAILFAKQDLTDMTIYVTHPPCTQCAAAIIQTGICKVICIKPSEDMKKRWESHIKESKKMFLEADVIYLEVPDVSIE